MQTINYTKLYKRATNRKSDKLGKIQEWSCWLEDCGKDGIAICRQSGQIDGKQSLKKKYIKKGKNIGKANETTALAQAAFELNNMVQAKLEDNCVLDIHDVDNDPTYLYPALAVSHDLKKTKALLKKRGYLYVQPKFNGARCWHIGHLDEFHPHVNTPTHIMMSRNLKPFDTIEHIHNAVHECFGDYTPDGEVFKEGFDFQTIISLLKKEYRIGENTDYPNFCTGMLDYHVYDLALPRMTYEERKNLLDGLIEDYYINNPGAVLPIIPVKTFKVTSMEEIDDYNSQFILDDYEGLIIRDPESLYGFNDRNDSLIKFKKFYDAEFKIIGHEVEIWDDFLCGIHRELVIWRCVTDKGFEFRSRPKGSFLERERLCKNASDYYGKFLTVRYQELSQDGVPIMNIGKGIIDAEGVRDYE